MSILSEQLWQDNGRIALENPVQITERRRVGFHVDHTHPRPSLPRVLDISRCWMHLSRRSDDQHEVDRGRFPQDVLLIQECIDVLKDLPWKLLAEPHDTGSEEVCLASGAVGEVCGLERRERNADVGNVQRFPFPPGSWWTRQRGVSCLIR